MTKHLEAQIKKIKLLALDVDGVLTNGNINIGQDGKETKVFDVQDGFGIVIIRHAGIKTAIISARRAGAVIFRAKDLKIDKVYQDAYPKIDAYEKMLRELKLKDEEVCFLGDDLPDLCILKRVGFAVSVPNGRSEVKKMAHYVTKNSGGKGAVREVVELILKSQNKWDKIVKNYSSGAQQ